MAAGADGLGAGRVAAGFRVDGFGGAGFACVGAGAVGFADVAGGLAVEGVEGVAAGAAGRGVEVWSAATTDVRKTSSASRSMPSAYPGLIRAGRSRRSASRVIRREPRSTVPVPA
jgi:hypothetical protein